MAFGKAVKYVRLYPDAEDAYDAAIRQANEKFGKEDHNICW